MGLYLAIFSTSRPCFFNIGVTHAGLRQSGKISADNDKLKSLVIGPIIESRQSMKSVVGMKSAGNVLRDEVKMSFATYVFSTG